MNKHQMVIEERDANIRIDRVLTNYLTDKSRAEIQAWIKSELVKVDGEPIKANYRCAEGQVVTWEEPEEETIEIKAEKLSLDIIYEDDDILVVNKEKGMVVYPTASHPTGTLVNGLVAHTKSLSTLSGEVRPGIVHRLDRDTSGLIVVAKHNEAHESLVKQFQDRKVKRSYLALVHGAIPHEYGTIEAPIGRDPNNRQDMTVVSSGKDAVTRFEVIERIDHQYSLIKCQLETGRTHQIRVHMKYIEFPIVGDMKYGQTKTIKGDGQALHAVELAFEHPTTKEWIEFKVDPPKSFQNYLNKARQV